MGTIVVPVPASTSAKSDVSEHLGRERGQRTMVESVDWGGEVGVDGSVPGDRVGGGDSYAVAAVEAPKVRVVASRSENGDVGSVIGTVRLRVTVRHENENRLGGLTGRKKRETTSRIFLRAVSTWEGGSSAPSSTPPSSSTHQIELQVQLSSIEGRDIRVAPPASEDQHSSKIHPEEPERTYETQSGAPPGSA